MPYKVQSIIEKQSVTGKQQADRENLFTSIKQQLFENDREKLREYGEDFSLKVFLGALSLTFWSYTRQNSLSLVYDDLHGLKQIDTEISVESTLQQYLFTFPLNGVEYNDSEIALFFDALLCFKGRGKKSEVNNFNIRLWVSSEEVEISYNKAAYRGKDVGIFLLQYISVVNRILKFPSTHIKDLTLFLPESFLNRCEPGEALELLKKHRALSNWNKPLIETEFTPITTLFLEQAETYPDAVSVEDSRSYSYRELKEASLKIAYYLGRKSCDTPVMITGEMSFGFVAAMLGTVFAGCIMITLDADLPSERKSEMLRLGKPQLVICVSEGIFEIEGEKLYICPRTGHMKGKEVIGNASLPELKPEQPAYIFFTSGSTGKPKGILGQHKSLSHFILWQKRIFNISKSDRVALTTNVSFDVVLRDVFLPLCSGAVSVIYRKSPMLKWLHDKKISTIHMVPSLAKSILHSEKQFIPSLRISFFAGEPLSKALVESWKRLNPSMRVVNLYGPTETTLAKCFYEVEATQKEGIQPIGHPLPQTQVIIFNSTTLKICGINEIGEIAIRTPYSTLGYLDKKLNEKSFVKLGKSFFYLTGDLGRYNPDLLLEIVGRRDRQIKINGVRIEPADIAIQMLKYPGVAEVAVSTRSNIHNTSFLVGYYVRDEKISDSIDQEQWKIFLSKYLPYVMIPQCYCKVDELPRLASGKIDFDSLGKINLSSVETLVRHTFSNTYEAFLNSLFKNLLQLKSLTVEDDFFQLGGHSLLAVQALSAIKERLGVDVSFDTFFQNSSIKRLATVISKASQQSRSESIRITKKDKASPSPLSSAQKRLFFLDQFILDRSIYNVALAIEFEGLLNEDVLEDSLKLCVARHEALRTAFRSKGENIYLHVKPSLDFQLQRVNFEKFPLNERKPRCDGFLRNIIKTPFDLSQCPLFRFFLIKLSSKKSIFYCVTHHIISDGWSTEILIHEISHVYNRLLQGRALQLPQIAFQYSDFAQSQNKWLVENRFDRQLLYWKNKLTSFPLQLDIKTQKTRSEQQSYEGEVFRTDVDIDLSVRVLSFAKKQKVTLFMMMISVYFILLRRFVQQDEMVIGFPTANRHYAGISNTFGYFVNLLPLTFKSYPKERFLDLLERVKGEVIESLINQDIPFDQLIAGLNILPTLQFHPLFQVTFVMQHEPSIESAFEGVSSRKMPTISCGSKFDLSLFVYHSGSNIQIEFEYSKDVFDEKTIKQLSYFYYFVLKGVVDNPEILVDEIQFVEPQWKNPVDDLDSRVLLEDRSFNQTIVGEFECIADAYAENLAIIDQQDQISYQKLNQKANRLAHFLRDFLKEKPSIIAVCLTRSIRLIKTLLAILKAGSAYLVIEPNLPRSRKEFILKDSEAALLLTDSIFKEEFLHFEKTIVFLDEVLGILQQKEDSNLKIKILHDDLAYVIYTSGSTGKPKGTLLEHKGVINLTRWQANFFHVSSKSRVSQFASYSFDGAVGETFMALLNGACLVMLNRDFDWESLINEINKHRINIVVLIPSLLKQLDPGKLKHGNELTVVSVGEVCPTSLAVKWVENCHFVNAYGPTEYTVYSHAYRVEKNVTNRSEIPIGPPMAHTVCYLLDSFYNPVPKGWIGEIYLTGAGIARGYLNQPQLTRERFIYNPFTLQKYYRERGVLDFPSSKNTLIQFERKRHAYQADVESVSVTQLKQRLKKLEPDLYTKGLEVLSKPTNSQNSRAILRYFKESYCNNYASCGINSEIIKQLLPFPSFKGLKGIDFGFGNGEILLLLNEIGAHVTGLDICPFFVQRMRDKGVEAYAAEIDCELNEFQKLKFSESFDFALSTLVLDRLEKPQQFLCNFFSVLRAGGKFAIQTLLPITGLDDGCATEPIVYTPEIFKITPGNRTEEDKRNLIGQLVELGGKEINVFQIPYKVVSRDSLQTYNLWSFCGIKSSQAIRDFYFKMYRTGDLGRVQDDGNFVYEGRIDDQIKLRGFRIELSEIEAAIQKHENIKNAAVISNQAHDHMEILAFLELDTGGKLHEKLTTIEKERGKLWENISDEIYSNELSEEDRGFNTIGWNSSYTGQPFSKDEMREWTDTTIERIQNLKFRKVLEVGCGTGLILSRVAPTCDSYVATDISAKSIAYIKNLIQNKPELSHVKVLQKNANQLSELKETFDVIILNSVIQYFPSQKFLENVLKDLLNLLAPKGTIFIGDVKNLFLQKQQEISIGYAKLSKSLTIEEFNHYIERKIHQEEELFLHPMYFKNLSHLFPRINRVHILLKNGIIQNELNLFRYDVTLNADDAKSPSEFKWHEWNLEEWDPSKVARYLKQHNPQVFALCKVVDYRISQEKALENFLFREPKQSMLKDFKFDPEPKRILPEEWKKLGLYLDYNVFVGYYHFEAIPYSYDVIFYKRKEGSSFIPQQLPEKCDIEKLANQPLKSELYTRLTTEVRERLSQQLPDYMIPSKFIILDQLPLTYSGKIDRKKLAIPAQINQIMESSYTIPRTDLEAKLTQIWKSLLAMDIIGVNDNFFKIGGHSLLATRLVAILRKELSMSLSIRSIFEYPTIATLAKYIQCKTSEENDFSHFEIPRADCLHDAPASFSQERIWFLNKLVSDGSIYDMPMAFRLEGSIEIKILEKALQELISRHEMLRTAFTQKSDKLFQKILPVLKYQLNICDISELSKTEQKEKIKKILEEQKRFVFDLESAPLFRVKLCILHKNASVLFITMHHIIGDGWSLNVFARELSVLYNAYKRGKKTQLPSLPIRYVDFACWQKKWLERDIPNSQLTYWKSHLYHARSTTKWKLPNIRPKVPSYRGDYLATCIPSDLLMEIRSYLQRKEITLYTFLFSAFYLTLLNYIESQEIVIGTPIANRHYQNVDNLIGCFVNTLPIRLHSHRDQSFANLLAYVKELILRAHENQDIPFEKLIEVLHLSGNQKQHPLFQVMFAMQNAGSIHLDFEDMKVLELKTTSGGAKFDLLLSVEEYESTLEVEFEYALDLFDRITIENMSRLFVQIVRKILETEAQTIKNILLSSLESISEDFSFSKQPYNACMLPAPLGVVGELLDQGCKGYWDRNGVHRVNPTQNDEETTVEVFKGLHLFDYLEEKRNHDDLLLVRNQMEQIEILSPQPITTTSREALEEGGALTIPANFSKTLTEAFYQTTKGNKSKGITFIDNKDHASFQSYHQLFLAAQKVLSGLQDIGLKPGDCAILQLDNQQDHFSVFWGCLLGGIIPVTIAIPKQFITTDAVAQKIYNTWELLNSPPIITNTNLTKSFSAFGKAFSIEDFVVLVIEDIRENNSKAFLYTSNPSDVAFYQLTSGSTGISKCIQLTHESIISHIVSSQLFNHDEELGTSLNWIAMDHVVPILTFHLRDIYLNWNQVQIATELILGAPLKWLTLMEEYKITHSWAPNFGFQLIAEQLLLNPEFDCNLRMVKHLMNAGEQVTLSVVSKFLKLVAKFGVEECVMQPAFGMAEVCTCMTYNNTFSLEKGAYFVDKQTKNFSLTRAIAPDNSKLNFIDLGPPIAGVSIRIVDKDNHLLREEQIGQLQIKGKVVTLGYVNNLKANTEAFEEGGWFNSGDLGFISEGRLFLTGRQKEMVIINGNNYYCYEIESVVNQIPGVCVTYSAAVSIKNPRNNVEELLIFFSPEINEEEPNFNLLRNIRTAINESFGVAPAYVLPISKKNFPKTTSGKIQRSQLKKNFINGGFDKLKKTIDLELQNNKTIPDWFFKKTWRELSIMNNNPIRQSTALVFVDKEINFDALHSTLERNGLNCIYVKKGKTFSQSEQNCFKIRVDQKEDYEKLLQSFDHAQIIDYVFHFWSFGESKRASSSYLHESVYSLLYFYQAFERLLSDQYTSENPLKLVVVSRYSQVVTAVDQLIPERSCLLGFLKTLNIEAPRLMCQLIDMASLEDDLHQELFIKCALAIQAEQVVAVRGGECLVPRLEKVFFRKSQKSHDSFQNGGCYLACGGLGGIGSHVVQMLASHYDCKLIIVGRDKLERSSRKKEFLNQMQSLNPYVSYHTVDISNRSEMEKVISDQLQEWSCPLDGILNFTGHFIEIPLIHETPENIEKSLASKLYGLKVLFEIFERYQVKCFVSFSSINGYFGGNGVGSYSLANSCESALSDYQRNKSFASIYCFHFSLWDNIGISQNYQFTPFAEARGFCKISLQKGLNSLRLGLSQGEYSLYVGLDPTNRHLKRNFYPKYSFSLRATHNSKEISHGVPPSDIELKLTEIWKDLLQLSSIERNASFFDLGGHSILAIRLITRIQNDFKVEIPMSGLFSHPKLFQLAKYIEELKLTGGELKKPSIIKRRKENN